MPLVSQGQVQLVDLHFLKQFLLQAIFLVARDYCWLLLEVSLPATMFLY